MTSIKYSVQGSLCSRTVRHCTLYLWAAAYLAIHFFARANVLYLLKPSLLFSHLNCRQTNIYQTIAEAFRF